MNKEKNIIDNSYCDNEVLNACDLWLEYLQKEKLLSNNTFQAYSIDVKYFLKFITNHLSKKVSIKSLENLSLRDFRSWLSSQKLKNNNTYLIKTSLDDLFQHNVYKLQYEDKEFIIPLWHNELYYSHNEKEIIVKCIPELPEHITIDEDNNIHVSVRVSLYTLFKNPDKKLEISVGQQTFSILVEVADV